ncbi:hypothetical protein [Pseudomonas sp. 2FG]|uniref:hypothetical protein n=1 Tax=Pseudomonas sp. 2FG TaxID=2502191 RepID=UPI003531EC61
MASPEVLGISAGAALGLITLLFLLPYSGPLAQLPAGLLAALLGGAYFMLCLYRR